MILSQEYRVAITPIQEKLAAGHFQFTWHAFVSAIDTQYVILTHKLYSSLGRETNDPWRKFNTIL